MRITLIEGKKIYFVSDHHFGFPTLSCSLEREEKFISWLTHIKTDIQVLFLLGDFFDFWFKFKKHPSNEFIEIKKNFIELQEQGIEIYFFSGNHDIYIKDYFKKELGIKSFHKGQLIILNQKKWFITHGDPPLLRALLDNRLSCFLFPILYKIGVMKVIKYFLFKRKQREKNKQMASFSKKRLLSYAKKKSKKINYDFLIMGHIHSPLSLSLDKKQLICIGDWLYHFSYAFFDGEDLKIDVFNKVDTN